MKNNILSSSQFTTQNQYLPIIAQKKIKFSLYHFLDLKKVLQYNQKYHQDQVINYVYKIVKENYPPSTNKSNNQKIACYYETSSLPLKIKRIHRWCFGLTKLDIRNIKNSDNNLNID